MIISDLFHGCYHYLLPPPKGCYLGLYFQTRAASTHDECSSMATGPADAYRDGYAFGKWGVRQVWDGDISAWYYTDDVQFRYVSEAFHAGLYDGSTAAGWPYLPNSKVSCYGSLTYRWVPEVWNGVYTRVPGGADLNTIGAQGWQDAFRYILSNYEWVLSDSSSPDLLGFPLYHSGDATHWVTPDTLRFAFGMECMLSMPLYVAGWPPTANEMSVFSNDAAIAVDQDMLRAPPSIVCSNASGMILSKALLNGDVAVALWNLNTKSATVMGTNLLCIPGVYARSVRVLDVFDGVMTSATNSLAATVNPGGLNLYRLLLNGNPVPAPIVLSLRPSQVQAGGEAFLLYVTGSNFLTNSVIRWNGVDQQTKYISSTSLRTTIEAELILLGGTVSITVFTPGVSPDESSPVALLISISAPEIALERSGNTLKMGWPMSALGFKLQSSPALPAMDWKNVPGSETTNLMSIPIGTGNQFYRLKK
jgi:hypothetical protein